MELFIKPKERLRIIALGTKTTNGQTDLFKNIIFVIYINHLLF
jgi:hypothetical protein